MANLPGRELPETPEDGRTLSEAKECIKKLYPGADLMSDDNDKKVDLEEHYGSYKDYLKERYEHWVWMKVYDPDIDPEELATILPCHEEILAFLLLSGSAFAEDLKSTIEENEATKHLVYAKPIVKKQKVEASPALGRKRPAADDSPADAATLAKKLRKTLRSELESIQKEKAELEKKEKAMLDGIKSVDSLIGNIG